MGTSVSRASEEGRLKDHFRELQKTGRLGRAKEYVAPKTYGESEIQRYKATQKRVVAKAFVERDYGAGQLQLFIGHDGFLQV